MIFDQNVLFQRRHIRRETPSLKTCRGVTLVEVLVTFVITAVMATAFTAPFMAERIFWRDGNQQLAAQRDAQLVLYAITRIARASNTATVTTPAAGQTQITLSYPLSTMPVTWAPVVFLGGAGLNNGKMQMTDQRVSPSKTLTLVDGVKSKVQSFTADFSNQILHLQLTVTNQSFGSETLETRIFLRNAS